MIIGISGKIGAGKDLAGQMLQYIASRPNPTFSEFENNPFLFDYKNPFFEEKKFADALKDCVCRIIGCTRAQLEDREFKEAPLGEEWWNYSLSKTERKIVDYNNSPYSGVDEAIANERFLEKMTPRLMLQLLGTEGGRNTIHNNIWVNAAMAGYDGTKNWIFTDMRFPNEMDAVMNRSGVTIRMVRGDGNTGDHPSETALDDRYHAFDYVIDNNGTIENLFWKMHMVLEDFHLI